MTYYLGVDLGTTFTSASTWRDGRTEIKNLGTRTAVIPSVVLLREDETILTGDSANRRGMTEPNRVAREFKRRLGDTTPIVVGGSPYSAEALMARLLESVTSEVADREGGQAAGIAITHPANWGEYKRDLLRQAVRMADLPDVTLLTEPEAAAIHYATENRVEVGQVIAVFDLGGGTFDAAVLRKTEDSFEILGRPEGIERLGGIDFDAAVFAHVARALGGALEELDEDDPTAVAAVARLRAECVDAKEALSSDTDTTIPALLPNVQTEVRITRNEFEGMIRPALADSIGAMRRALDSAGVTPEQISAVLLVGGSSRIPLVAQLVGSELGRPVAVDLHPKHAVAHGAAVAAAQAGGAVTAAPAAPAAPTPPVVPVVPVAAAAAVPPPEPPAPPVATPTPAAPPEPVPTTPPATPPAPQPTPEPVAAAAPTPPAPEPVAAAPPTEPTPVVDTPTGEHGLRQDPTRTSRPDAPEPIAADDSRGAGGRKGVFMAVAAVALLAVLAVGALALRGGDDGGDDPVAAGDEPAADDGAGTGDETDQGGDEANGVAGEPTATPTPTPEAVVEAPPTEVPPTATTAPTPTPTTPPDEVCPDDQENWVCLTSVEVVEGTVQATYDTSGYIPSVGNAFHYHFYGNARTEEFSGSQGNPDAAWVAWDQATFTRDFTDGSLSLADSDKLCVIVGDALTGHRSILGTGNCLPLP